MRQFEYIFAPVGACVVFVIFLAFVTGSSINFFPMPALLVAIFTAAYVSFRRRLDVATPFETNSEVSAARIGLAAILVSALVAMAIIRFCATLATPAHLGYSSEWVDGSVQTQSTDELLDMFVSSQDLLAQHGFQPSAEADFGMGMKSGLISPHMATFYYKGAYNGSPPFIFRLDIDRDGKQLIAYADPAAASKKAYDALEGPSRDFVRYYNQYMKNELAAYRSRGGHL